ncbi:MAG: class II glutamine amidotransferase [Promethearchaeota archaeon]
MCRMFLKCSNKSFVIDYNILKQFVKSCHWSYFKKYNILGHHNLGWGFAYLLEDKDNLKIKRDLSPIYHGDWKGLTKIKTRFLVVHARKAYPWQKNKNSIHPININEKYVITHNGVIKKDSFPTLYNSKLQKISNNTTMDTRRYLCYLIDRLKKEGSIEESVKKVLQTIRIGEGANAFLFNSSKCNIISYHSNTFIGRHTTLFLKKRNDSIFCSTTPIIKNSKEIPNNTLIQIDLKTLNTKVSKIRIK